MTELSGYRKPLPKTQPEYLHEAYGSTIKRAPQHAPIAIAPTLSELTGPRFDAGVLGPHGHDLTAGHAGAPLGERIWVTGRVLDDAGRPVPETLLEVWQCNAAGRYRHEGDQHDAPLDPNFTGEGRVLTDAHGNYRFKTIKPGAYPWRNHYNAWRPAHIHVSLFGPAWSTRLVTQLYFPGDPLLAFDPIYQSIADEQARLRLVASFDWASTESEYALGYRFDVVLRGRLDALGEGAMSLRMTGSQTVGPFFRIGLSHLYKSELAPAAPLCVRGRVFDGDGAPVPDALLELWQADARGRYANTPEQKPAPADSSGFARVPTDAHGGYEFRSYKPGRVGQQAPHISVHVLMRGLLKPVHTRLYFPGEASNAEDAVLACVPEARRATLIGHAQAGEPNLLLWDIHMQGEHETVFFSY